MSAAAATLGRELRLALRSGGGAGLGLGFFLIVVLLAPFGVGPDAGVLALLAPGVLWIAALLACQLSLDRLFQADAEDGTLDILALSPLPLEALVALKALAHWLTTGLPLVVAAPLLGVTLSLPGAAYPWLVASLAIGTPGLSFLGAIGASVTVGVRRGGLLLSVLVLPLYIPSLIFGARTVSSAAEGGGPPARAEPAGGTEPRDRGDGALRRRRRAARQPALRAPRHSTEAVRVSGATETVSASPRRAKA